MVSIVLSVIAFLPLYFDVARIKVPASMYQPPFNNNSKARHDLNPQIDVLELNQEHF